MQLSFLGPLSSLILPVVSFLALLLTALFVAANMRTRKKKVGSVAGMLGFLILAVAVLMPIFNFVSNVITNIVTALGSLLIMSGYVFALFQRSAKSSEKSKKRTEKAEKSEEVIEENPKQVYAHAPKPIEEEERRERRAIREDTGLRAEPLVHLPKQKRIRARKAVTVIISLVVFILVGWGSYLVAKYFINPQPSMNVATPDFVFETPDPSPVENGTESGTKAEEKNEENKQNEEASNQEENEQEPKNTVTIADTETGWLNVREGASTATKIITKINPGETYEILEENEGSTWYKIMVDDNAGWISAQYATKD